MRIGIYNRWLPTLGGGEKHSLAIAEYLSHKHSVFVITHTPVPVDLAASRLNLDLSRVEFVSIPERLAPEITPITAEYDFFINASHMDYFLSLARINAMLVYFPVPVQREPVMRFRRWVKHTLRRLLMLPAFLSGVIELEAGEDSLIRWADILTSVNIPHSSHPLNISLEICPVTADIERVECLVEGIVVADVNLSSKQGYVPLKFSIPPTSIYPEREIIIMAVSRENVTSNGRAKIGIRNFEIENPRYRLYRRIFERQLKSWALRLHYISPGVFSILDSLNTYDQIWANSEYTRRWIKKYWNKHSNVLYPPVNIEKFHPLEKCNRILSVGRFFAGSHNKKHMVMIKAFKKMVANGLSGWELHLAGGSTSGITHDNYLDELYSESHGFPIVIHTDIPFNDLVRLYGESSIYWHAGGFGEDENRDPAKFEHFGITTVEAMASGCVPVVIGKGGQPEIVKHGKNGFLWQTMDELRINTNRLIQDVSLRQALSEAAIQDSQKYGLNHFHKKVASFLNQLGIE
jgi:glycosyltransferase involved in cell wall biosynthesis